MKATYEKPRKDIAYKKKKKTKFFLPAVRKKQNKTQGYSKWAVLVMGQVGNKFRHTYVLTQTLYLYWIHLSLTPSNTSKHRVLNLKFHPC